ncbi:site-specific integrase [Alphaproteobacteria bacterium]|nr:site-specific integrase [Alphaproteobacteria bacterium]
MANKGIPVRLISELLGHTNIQTTLRFAHVFDKTLSTDLLSGVSMDSILDLLNVILVIVVLSV